MSNINIDVSKDEDKPSAVLVINGIFIGRFSRTETNRIKAKTYSDFSMAEVMVEAYYADDVLNELLRYYPCKDKIRIKLDENQKKETTQKILAVLFITEERKSS